MVSVTTRPLLPTGKTQYPLYRSLSGPHGRCGQVGKITPPPGFVPWTVGIKTKSHPNETPLQAASSSIYTPYAAQYLTQMQYFRERTRHLLQRKLNRQKLLLIQYCGSGSSVGIATELPGCTVRGSNPCGYEIFRTCPDQPWGPPSLL